MIVRMKEIVMFALASKVEEAIQDIGELGVVEVRELNVPSGERLERVAEKLGNVQKALSILDNVALKELPESNRKKYNTFNPRELAGRILLSQDIKKRCLETMAELQRQRQWYECWGKNIDLNDFKFLFERGVNIRLYNINKGKLSDLPQDTYICKVSEKEDSVQVALVSRSAAEQIEFKEVQLPSFSMKKVEYQLTRRKRQLNEVDLFLQDMAENISLLQDYESYLQDRLSSVRVLKSMDTIKGQIKCLKGFIPAKEVASFKKKAQQKNWGYQISEPADPDEVPVYIKNPKWVSIINPVLKFIDIVPGYKEVDVSIYFLLAFSLFFAMLVGDAGYGALFLITTFLLRKKMTKEMRILIYVLSGSTIVWGILSGTYFGSEQIAALPFLKQLIVPQISSFGANNISFMMHLSFLIGAIHLTIAHTVRAIKYINSSRVLSEIGWISFVWGLFFLAEKLVLGKAMPEWNNWLFLTATVLVVLFSREAKGFFASILSSIANLPLSLINGFSDIVSYVRLFAVGMATATVAASFNNMILPQGVDHSFLGLLMAAVALFLGHGLNIILALMAVMVHGIRLNMLEFAGHLGVQFSGEAYKPFKISRINKNENF